MNPLRITPLVLLATTMIPALAAAEDCPPIAVVRGTGKVAQELASALIGRGIRVEPAGLPGGVCAVLHAEITATPNGYSVWIGDSWGRTAERKVRDVLTAVTLVESWARMDLLEAPGTSSTAASVPVVAAAPAPEPQPEKQPEKAPEEAAPVAEAAPVLKQAIDAPLDDRPGLSIRVAGEGVMTLDRARWIGGAVSVCGRMGPACVGLVGRYNISQSYESNIEGLAALRLPIELGRFTLTPHIGAGIGYLANTDSRVTTLEVTGGRRGGGRFGLDQRGGDDELGPRAQAGVDLSLRLFGDLHLEAGAVATANPSFARRFELDEHTSGLHAHVGLVWGSP